MSLQADPRKYEQAMPTNSHLIVTVHGIRTYGPWQERLERLVKNGPNNHDVEFVNYKFLYISTISFVTGIE